MPGQGRCLHGLLQLFLIDMGINLGCGNIFMAQYFFERQHINTALVHQGCSRVPQFVGRISASGQACALQAAFHNLLHAPRCQPLPGTFGYKHCTAIHKIGQSRPRRQIMRQCVLAGAVQVNEALFAAFANNTDRMITIVSQINGDQLGKPHATI